MGDGVKLGGCLLAVGLCLVLNQPVMAQTQDDQGKSIYEAAFFSTFSTTCR